MVLLYLRGKHVVQITTFQETVMIRKEKKAQRRNLFSDLTHKPKHVIKKQNISQSTLLFCITNQR